MLGYAWLGYLQSRLQLTDTHRLVLQQLDDSYPIGIRKAFHHLEKILHFNFPLYELLGIYNSVY